MRRNRCFNENRQEISNIHEIVKKFFGIHNSKSGKIKTGKEKLFLNRNMEGLLRDTI